MKSTRCASMLVRFDITPPEGYARSAVVAREKKRTLDADIMKKSKKQ